MITQRDLDTIGPRPTRYALRPQPAGAATTLASPPVSVAAVLTVRGPCPGSVLDDLHERVAALLGAGVGEFFLDLSEVTAAHPRLLRAIDDLHHGIDEAGGELTLAGAPGAGASPDVHTDSRPDACSIYRGVGHPTAAPPAPPPDAITTGSGAR
jgi:hypothetical protein